MNFVPFSSNTSSSFFGSSRAMPSEGPDQPIDIVIRIAELPFLPFRNSFITSDALSVTVNMKLSPSLDIHFTVALLYKLSIFIVLSIIFLKYYRNTSIIMIFVSIDIKSNSRLLFRVRIKITDINLAANCGIVHCLCAV
jgi:hypothetical protein